MLIGLIVVSSLSLATISRMEEMDEEEYVEIDSIKVGTSGFIFFSDGDNCTGIIAKTSEERAKSLNLGLENKIENRPNTHDIYAETIEHFNISLDKVIITKIEDNTFISDLIFRKENRILKLDSKPSDAMALALRTNSSIYMNKTLYDIRKENICNNSA